MTQITHDSPEIVSDYMSDNLPFCEQLWALLLTRPFLKPRTLGFRQTSGHLKYKYKYLI